MPLYTEHDTIFVGSNDAAVRSRIRAEFTEMPGLKLTLPQAARLFGLERGRCQEILGGLVTVGILSVIGGAFVRADTGRRHA